ncbi:hypothetical protein OLP40_04480 [Campylobacter jejuni]|nr:hypothetical protein C414_000020036 [Campylobacter jejuni subsp. jejuni 414]MCW1333549.1 hypothetical protein [Campylobacter jejuni]MCW1359065.1 hypothetical protein [Campylobacter jejuni]
MQDYKTYAQYKEQEHKLTQIALELKKKFFIRFKKLKSKENELQEKIEQHEKHIQTLELGHQKSFK